MQGKVGDLFAPACLLSLSLSLFPLPARRYAGDDSVDVLAVFFEAGHDGVCRFEQQRASAAEQTRERHLRRSIVSCLSFGQLAGESSGHFDLGEMAFDTAFDDDDDYAEQEVR